MSRFTPLLAACLFSTGLSAQSLVSIGIPTSGLARTMNNNNNCIAETPDGAMWTVVYDVDLTGSNGRLVLKRSTDNGTTWSTGVNLPNFKGHNHQHNNSGCIVAGRRPDRLHVAWADKEASTVWSAQYQEFDTSTQTWIGTPTLLAQGTGSNNQFWPVDIGVTEKGTVVVCISGHRSGGLGLGSWDCGLAVKKPGGSFNSTLYNLRQGGASYSQNASIAIHGEVVHTCMKNATGGYGICYRAYDTETDSWLQASQVAVGPSNNSGIAAGNKSVIAVDSGGGIYVLYVTGNSTAARTLRLAYAPPGKGSLNGDWQDISVIANTATVGQNYRNVASTASGYPILQGGNTTYRNYSLSAGTMSGGLNNAVVVAYSKPFEDFSKLYTQVFAGGVQTIPEIQVSSPTNVYPLQFEWVTGLRQGDRGSEPAFVTYGKTDAAAPNNGPYANGQVAFWRIGTPDGGRTVAFGVACQGSLNEAPRIQAKSARPRIGQTYTMSLDRFPASTNLFLALGTKPYAPGIDLGIMGAPGCTLDIDVPLVVGLKADSSGQVSLPTQIANDTKLIGVTVYTQSLCAAPGANAGGLLTSNALMLQIGR